MTAKFIAFYEPQKFIADNSDKLALCAWDLISEDIKNEQAGYIPHKRAAANTNFIKNI